MPCFGISDCAQMSKTIIAAWHFELGGRQSLETAVNKSNKIEYKKNMFLERILDIMCACQYLNTNEITASFPIEVK